MIQAVKYVLESTLQLFYPHRCPGCGSDAMYHHESLCFECKGLLPKTGFELHPGNPVEKLFWGRLNVTAACSIYHFSKGTLMQTLLHSIKYGGDQRLARYLGYEMGKYLSESETYKNIDGIVPVPLHKQRERKRGYNQSALLAEGMSERTGIKNSSDTLSRNYATGTQTKMSRVQRWQNVRSRFECKQTDWVRGKHLLLIDDVITTGATLDSCGQCLLDAGAASLRIATLAYAAQ